MINDSLSGHNIDHHGGRHTYQESGQGDWSRLIGTNRGWSGQFESYQSPFMSMSNLFQHEYEFLWAVCFLLKVFADAHMSSLFLLKTFADAHMFLINLALANICRLHCRKSLHIWCVSRYASPQYILLLLCWVFSFLWHVYATFGPQLLVWIDSL